VLSFIECTLWARPCARPFPTHPLTDSSLNPLGKSQYSRLTDEETTLCEVREPALCLEAGRLSQDGKRISCLLLHHNITTNLSSLRQHTFVIPSSPKFLRVRSAGMA